MTSDNSRTHQERFRCPQCDLMVTVSTAFRGEDKGKAALVSFQCTMEGLCGSPLWDPCPMYVVYMEQPPRVSR